MNAERERPGISWWRVPGFVTLVVALALSGAGMAAGQESVGAARAIATLDLERYAGLWHEIARFPNRFQDRCASNVTATYELRGDSTIRVINRCRTAKGDSVRAEGRARLADRHGPASRLKVRFAPAILSFVPGVWADYWVREVTDDYRAALVGTPDRRYLWVLSREPELDQATYDRLLETAAAQGFEVARIKRSGE